MNLPSTEKGLREWLVILEILEDSYSQGLKWADHKAVTDFYAAKVKEVKTEIEAIEDALCVRHQQTKQGNQVI